MIKTRNNVPACPVSNLRLYIKVLDVMGVDLRKGYLFRTTNKEGAITDNPFVGSAVTSRLLHHLKTLGIHNRETTHSFQSHCSITLSLIGVVPEDVARHVRWKSSDAAE